MFITRIERTRPASAIDLPQLSYASLVSHAYNEHILSSKEALWLPESRSNIPDTSISTKEAATPNRADNGVSVILCTNRRQFLSNIFANYGRQLYKPKELILVLNKNKMDVNKYQIVARRYQNVSVYQLDESMSLGRCLNFATSKAKYSIVTKFDDDDYYSPYYLNGVI